MYGAVPTRIAGRTRGFISMQRHLLRLEQALGPAPAPADLLQAVLGTGCWYKQGVCRY